MEVKITWYEIILKNWSQITVIIGVIGFVIKTMTTFLIKKKEITFSRLQENTILEIKTFFKSYSALVIALRNYLEQMKYDVVRRPTVSKENLKEYKEHIDEIYDKQSLEIYNRLINYRYNAMTIKLFLENKDVQIIEGISETLSSIESNVRAFHQKIDSSDLPKDCSELETIVNDSFLEKLPSLLDQIEKNLRKKFEFK